VYSENDGGKMRRSMDSYVDSEERNMYYNIIINVIDDFMDKY
jgi:hypothetical protein